MRIEKTERNTAETQIVLSLNLDGTGKSNIKTGCGFMDHMMTLFAKHGRIDLDINANGDTFVDDHHTVEDIGIVLGETVKKALGDKKGITRYGHSVTPMDETLILSAIDISGRGMLCFDLDIPSQKVGTFDTELVKEFFDAFARNAGITLHIKQLAGVNSHHIIEGTFKSVAQTLRKAVKIDEESKDEIPSTKGVL